MRKQIFLFLLLVPLILAACAPGGGPASDSTPAVKALESYLQALVNKDEATLTSLSCQDWEPNALLELDAFQAVDTTLEGLVCKPTRESGDTAQVTCQGKIQATYGDEVQSFDLGERVYNMAQQGGDWLVCGY